ncbi:MAG: GntR family transcriptional regulator [Propionibacteriaceae bacterium]|nr:GntR family transcriptional regulator [Propionibacteriaceae bacterium]
MSKRIRVTIERTSPVPLYHQVAEQLSAAIENGELQPGDTFENELSLAERLELSRPTIRRAIAELVNRGLLVRRRGIGTTVASKAIHRKAELTSLYEDLVASGRKPLTTVIAYQTDVTDANAAEKMGLPFDSPLLYVERLRSAGDIPMALLRNWLPFPESVLPKRSLANHGMYALLRENGIQPAVGHQIIGARRPNGQERQMLGLKPGDPLLTMSRVAFDAAGKPVEFGDHCYRWDQYFIDITVYER